LGQLRAHIGRDRIANRLLVEPTHQLVLIERAVAAQVDLGDAARAVPPAPSRPTRRSPEPAGTPAFARAGYCRRGTRRRG
jgi:hypothetical protein